jgi:hypothetical protein
MTRGRCRAGIASIPYASRSSDAAESDRFAYTSFIELGGRSVSLNELCQHLGDLQLDMVLGVLGRISAHHASDEANFFHPGNQGSYLNCAIADDFPAPLPGAATMYVPNGVPITGGRHIFIHEHGLLALAQLAALHCRTDAVTAELSLSHFGRVCRLLLILNSHLVVSEAFNEAEPTLVERRRFALNQLFYAQFNQLTGNVSGHLALARLHQLLTRHLPNHLRQADELFRARIGLSVQGYLGVAGLMFTGSFVSSQQLGPTVSPWTNIERLLSFVRHNRDEVRAVLECLCQTPEELRQQVRPDEMLVDFDALQRRPLIMARPDQMLAPVVSSLLRQLVSFPLQVIAKLDGGPRALGMAYEDYAHSLVERIARGDKRGAWKAQRNLPVARETDIGSAVGEMDSVLWRDGIAVVIEHKAGNLLLALGSRAALRNALGPTDDELALFPAVPKKDGGAITHGLWQLVRIAPHAEASLKARFGAPPQRVFPIINTLQPFQIDGWIRRGYLLPVLAATNAKLPPSWAATDWAAVEELEALAQLADDGGLDLLDLLSGREPSSGRLICYLVKRFEVVPWDAELVRISQGLMQAVSTRYFGAPLPVDSREQEPVPGTEDS